MANEELAQLNDDDLTLLLKNKSSELYDLKLAMPGIVRADLSVSYLALQKFVIEIAVEMSRRIGG
jgi:hypothetical protein